MIRRITLRALAAVGTLILAPFVGAGHGMAQTAGGPTPEQFYRGKSISVVIGYSAGGGYDIYARALARHMGRHVPGNPTFVAQNMPGAASQKALEYILTHAPKDGLSMGAFNRSLAIAPLIENAKFDLKRLEWVGSITTDTSTCVIWAATGIKTWEDLKSRPITLGGLGRGSDPEMFALIVKNMFGMPIKVVSGYPGTNDVALAVERGEVDGMCGFSYSSLKAARRNWLDERKVNIVVQAGLTRDPAIPAEVPMLLEKAGNELQRKALELILAPQAVARPFALPPGTPADRVVAMRKAFMATMADPEFLAEAGKAGLDVAPIEGGKITELYSRIYETPADVIAEARRAVGN